MVVHSHLQGIRKSGNLRYVNKKVTLEHRDGNWFINGERTMDVYVSDAVGKLAKFFKPPKSKRPAECPKCGVVIEGSPRACHNCTWRRDYKLVMHKKKRGRPRKNDRPKDPTYYRPRAWDEEVTNN